ncbi:hypothetical protein AcdelDRAFT_0514 [Acidovorax delafieldii 2AN]|uniref:DUF5666 domain-containing protein n=1 Tax=Acidovorax delafieldii 2AN TaxID=573060 RepID=C5T0T4_ACIDE|nr:DUF5666 domain-containing protein [Acidovorax delafieldii]EER61892.1 hypothetical protein AcdelDRAFT_0514 [Acidovorax delafieldii 2AN]
MAMNMLGRAFVLVVAMALTACGGGGSSSSTGSGGAGGVVVGGSGGSSSPDGNGSSGSDGSGSGTGGADSGSGGSGGSGTGDSGTGGAGGGTGAGSGGDSSASGPGDSGGVGSGGTGAAAASVAVGVADGFGSVIMNGVRFNVDTAHVVTEDAVSLQLGMTASVRGSIDAGLTAGTATEILSIPELRGLVSKIDVAAGQLEVMGVVVSVDEATAFAGVTALSDLRVGAMVQVYALPNGPGRMRATRIEVSTSGTHTRIRGAIQNLNATARTFRVEGLTVNYAAADFAGGLTPSALAEGMAVYVRASGSPSLGVLTATQLYRGHTLPTQSAAPVTLLGMVTDYVALGSFSLQGVPVDASAAQVTGGREAAIGNGVKLDVTGTMANGVLVASKVRIRNVPGTGGPVSFNVIGVVAQFKSAASFRVNGQPINASRPAVTFVNGSAANLRNGVQVNIKGDQVVEGVLQANEVRFE